MPAFTDYLTRAATAALSGTGTFAQETREQATLTANNAQLPLIVLGNYPTSLKATNDRLTRAEVSMFFGDSKEGQGDNPEAENSTVANMELLKRRFLAALDANPTVEITNIRAVPINNTYEAELTGVGVQFTLGIPSGTLTPACAEVLPTVPPLNVLLTEAPMYLVTEA